MIHLGPLDLPLDFVSQAAAILGIRGGGKSNLAALIAEGLYDAKLPLVVIDPEGSWYGLRVGSKALAIPIFGGEHADVPLEPGSGKLVARIIAEERLSCIVDTSELSETAKRGFLADFGEELYRCNRHPLHLILEEADDYLPQQASHDRARTLRAWETIVRRGRKRGLGCTMVTQRSASINKDVLTQVDTLFVLRTTAPQDHKAIEGWLKHQGQSDEVMASLSKLEAGECWVWSPFYLKKLERVQLPRRRTFDSGATPKAGKVWHASTLATVDLDAVREKMSATIERAKAEDPAELRRALATEKKRVAELERELAKKPAALPKTVEVPVFKKDEVRRLKDQLEDYRILCSNFENSVRALGDAIVEAVKVDGAKAAADLSRELAGGRSVREIQRTMGPPRPLQPGDVIGPKTAAAIDRRLNGSSSEVGKGGLYRILVSLAQRPQGLTQRQIGVRAGLSSKSGTFSTYTAKARTSGWIEGGRGDMLRITDEGLKALGGYTPLPTGRALLEHWLRDLGGGAARLLSVVAEAYPNEISQADAAERAGLSGNSGTCSTYLAKLRTLELISGRGTLRASDELFE